MPKPAKRLPIEEKVRVVLAVLGEMSASEAARRHGVSVPAVLSWRNRFLDAGRQSLADRVPGGPSRNGGSGEERRLRLENGQLKMALAEATVQLRMWQKGAEYTDQVPSATSKP